MNQSISFKSKREIENYQLELLLNQLEYVSEHSPFYKEKFGANKTDLSKIKSLSDLKLLPLTSKEELAQNNEAFYCVLKSEIIDYCTTSGTTGKPVVVGLTENDLNRLATNEMLSFQIAGLTKNDIVQLMLTIDKQFMAGMAYYLGLRKLGCGVVRSGPGSVSFQLEAIRRHNPNVIIAVPSFILRFIDYCTKAEIDVNKLGIKKIICIGEPIFNEDFFPNILAQKINEQWNVKLFGTYASTEMQTAFTECEQKQGAHAIPELMIAEVLDEKGNEVTDGTVGELTITHLGIEGFPLVRFQTGDLVQKHSESCKCGRNSIRLGPVIARKNQMIKYKGTTVYPNAIINILKEFSIEDFIIFVAKNEIGEDDVTVKISASHSFAIEGMLDMFRTKIRVIPTIEIVTKEHIESYRDKDSRKPKQIVFKR
jgi:phenylacetate-CoA ligase